MENYEIQLGIGLNTTQFDNVKNKIKSLEDDKITLQLNTQKVDSQIDGIKKQLQDLGKGNNKNVSLIDTSKLEKSLVDVKDIIGDIRTALSSLDGKGMKSIVSSINQMATALGKAENKSDSLVKSLSALSKKDFSLNIDLGIGKKNNNNMIAYGRAARKQVIPELESQIKELESLFGGQQATMKKLMSKGKDVGFDIFADFDDFNSDSAIKKMEAMEKYINSMKKLATIDNIKLDGFNEIHKDVSELINDIAGVDSAVDKAGDVPEKLKNIFGGSVDGENLSKQLESVVTDLKEIKATMQTLSSGASLDGLIQSFNRLSDVLDKLDANFDRIKNNLGSGFKQSIKQSLGQSLNLDSVIDQEVLKLMENFGISASGKNGKNAFNDIKQAVVDYRKELSSDVSDDLNIDSGMKKITSAIADNYREVIKLDEAYENLLMDINRVNDPKNGYKVHLIDEIKQEWGDDYRSNRATLGNAFGTGNYGVDLASWIRDKSWSHLIDLDQSDQDIANQLLDAVKFAREYSKTPVVTGNDLLKKGYWNINDVEAEITSTLNAINNAEQQIAQSSTQSANVVVQNEERKQQAYEDTLTKQKQRVEEIDRSIDDYTNRLINPNVGAEDGQRYMNSIDTLEQEKVEILANIEKIESALKGSENILNSFRNSLQNIGMGSEQIDTVTNRIANLGVQIETLNQKKSTRYFVDENGNESKQDMLSVDISGVDEYGNAIKLTQQYDMATAELIKSIDKVSTVQQKAGTSTDKFVKQQKRAVSDLSNQAKQLHSSAIDQNASRPIKETVHLDALKSKYKEIEDAIEVMGNASNEAFTEEQIKVKDLIADYKIMKNEFKNAENVSSSLKGTDFKSGLEIAKNDLEKFKANASDFPQIIKTIEELDKAIASVGDKSSLDSFTDQLKVARAELAKVKAETIATNRKEKVGINVSGVTSQIANIQRISPEINEFKTVIDGAEVSVESLLNDLSRVNTAGDFSVVKARFKAFEDAAESAGIAITEVVTKASTIDKIKFKISDTGFNGFTQEVARAHADVEKLDGTYNDLTNSLKELDIAMERVYSAKASGDIQALANANKEYEASLKRVTSQLKLYQQEEDRAFKNEMLDQKRTALNSDMEIWLKENTRAVRNYGKEIRELQNSLNGLDDKGLRLAGKQFTNIKKQAQAMGKTGLTVFDQLKAKAAQYASYLSAAEIFMYAEQAFRSMFEQVKLIDSAMTELKKVTDETNASYDRFLTNVATRAKEIGTTIDGLVSSTADFARLGYNFEDAQGLAEVANIYAVVGDEIEGVEGATQNLISTLAAFKDEMNGMSNTDFAMSIIDSLNELGNNYAISSGGLGEALKRSASSLAAANNTFHESVALITASNTVAQNPDKVGNALKTISMRLRSAKSEMEELGEDTEGMVDSTATLRAEIKALSGVDIMATATEFKSTYQILDELSRKWSDLSDIARATIIEKMAGKHQGNVFASLMENFGTARSALETSLNSEGSAMREHAKASESLELKLNSLKAAWQGLSQAFLNSDFLKKAIDILTDLTDVVTKLIESLGSFGTIGFVASIVGVFKNFKTLKDIGVNAFTALTTNAKESSESLAKWSKASKGIASGGKALMSTISGVVGVIGTVVAIAGLAYNAYKNYREEQSRLRQETIQTSDTFLDAANSFEQAYIKYSDKTNLTVEEEAELETAIKGTITALGDKSGALESVINSSNDYLSILERITDAELRQTEKAAKAKRDAAKEELKELAIGSARWEGSEINVNLGQNKDIIDIAKKLDPNSKYFSHLDISTGIGRTTEHNQLYLSGEASTKDVVNYYNYLVKLREELADAKDGELVDTEAYKDITAIIEELADSVGVYVDSMYEASKAQYQLKNGIPKTTEEYIKMRESILKSKDIKGLVLDERMNILNSLDSEYSKLFDLSTVEAQARRFVGIIKGYGDGTKDGTNEIGTVETFLNMRTAVNNDECTVSEYLSELNNVTSMANKFSKEEREEFNLAFGINSDEVKKQYDHIYNYISRNYLEKIDPSNTRHSYVQQYIAGETKRIKGILDNLTASELRAAVEIKGEIDWNNTSTDEILKQIEEKAELIEAMEYTINITAHTEGINALNTAMAESVTGAGLSSESIEALKSRYAELESKGYDLSSMFEETSNGIHLNREAVDELERAYANQQMSEADGQLEVLKNRYDELTTEIKNCTDAGKRASLYTEQQEVAQRINDLATLTSQYEGLTSAYNAWQNAEASGNERDMYEGIISGFETIEDELSRGWLDDGTIKFLELLTGKTNLVSKSGKELKKIYDDLDNTIKNTTYSVRDFFTVDDEGNSTNTGVYNFLDAIGQLEEEKFDGKDVVKRDKTGNIIGFDFELVAKKDKKGNVIKNGDQVIAEALGISEELVQIMVRASDDAGFVVNIEGAYTQLADLRTSAEESESALKKLKTNGLGALKDLSDEDLEFNFEANNLEDLNTELEKANVVLDKFKDKNGQLKKDKNGNLVKGAKQALEVASYFTATIDKLTEPIYMQLETNQVEDDLQEPLTKMQEFERLSKKKHQLKLAGDTEELKKTEKKMKEIVDYIYNNDDLKAKLEIEGLSKKEIEAKLEKGEIEIPATVDIQLEMSDDIKDMRLMMMQQIGLISKEQAKLEIEYGVDYSALEDYKPEQQEAVVKYFAEHKEVDNYEPEEKEAVVKLVANGVDLDNYEAEDKEAIVNYIANGEEADGWTPEAKDAFVKYLADGGEIDKFDPKNKESWVVYDTDTTKPDNYNADKNGTVTFEKDSSAIDNWKPTVTGVAKFVLSMIIPQAVRNALAAVGISIANGTANVDGTAFADGSATELKLSGRAFARGDWRTKKTETALTGELGREIVVTPDNRWYTVGDSGAEFATIPKGSIVFNHRQTEELFKNGKVTSGGGRGRALVGGTAFKTGSTGSGGGLDVDVKDYTVGNNPSSKKKSSSSKTSSKSKSSSSSSDSAEEFKEVIDWIEIALKRVQREIDNLDQKANNVYKSWSSRNTALSKEIGKVGSEINLQQQAYNRYIKEANSVGLSSSWAKRVQNGTIDISTIKDEALAEKIKNYQDWYEKALACKDAIEELKETEASLYRQRFDNVQTQYDAVLQGYEHTEAMLNEYINQAETQGHIVSKKYYQALINNEKSNIAKLKQEQSALIKARDEAVDSGKIAKYSEDWYNMCNEIDSVTQAIEESNTALLEFDNSMREIDWSIFDLVQERISAVSDEAEFLIELMSNDKLFDDKGKLTGQGAATLGLHALNHNTAMYKADDYQNEINKLDKQIVENPYDQELINRRQELLELQREMILNAEQEKEAIRDLVEEGIDLELSALDERIQKYEESLDSQKD